MVFCDYEYVTIGEKNIFGEVYILLIGSQEPSSSSLDNGHWPHKQNWMCCIPLLSTFKQNDIFITVENVLIPLGTTEECLVPKSFVLS